MPLPPPLQAACLRRKIACAENSLDLVDDHRHDPDKSVADVNCD
jgi:hypothetical protein